MSRTALKKDTSYSEFRKKNSLSKSNLHQSMLEMDNSISVIADEKTQELLSMENQLQSLVRNRSLSFKPSAKSLINESFKLNLPLKSDKSDKTLQISKKNSIDTIKQTQNPPKTNRSINYQSFNQTFQIIEESEVYNQQDNSPLQLNSKVTTKNQNKIEKKPLPKRKDSSQLMNPIKTDIKATLKDLDEMTKRLESVKKAKKFVDRDPKAKKTEIIRQPTQKIERRLHKTPSEGFLTSQNVKLKGLDILKEKQLASKQKVTKKLSFMESAKPISETEGILIPTKMVNLQQKQKLLKQFDKAKESIKNTDISADNLAAIRNMLKNIEGLIN